ncbi:conserved hypothetical protein [Renibacterium salmoninarum ATCC 33209]|uniref:Septum formation-related domain-containing protein n=1 Tax=Renibacterium salmoninarum (strain ATCC 33209 / DSM 20767 / JCM 11484 / NBRC 15589 / NCIMB 2235) TaxID=288705 RepID=A9WQP6_RENSM|nr:conserved hypothetical protein [Renibacterium salmoninarum ATCC 33209]
MPGNPPSAWNQQPGGPQGPYGPGGPQGPGGPFGSGQPQKSNTKLWIFVGAGVVLIALIVLVIWLVSTLIGANKTADSDRSPAASASSQTSKSPTSSSARPSSSDGSALVPNASPSTWLVGDCIRTYVDINTKADVVSCSTGHSGQLIGTFYYKDSDAFPGADALKAKGDAYCAVISLTSDASNYDIRQQYGYPTESTWAKGDGRIDCIAYTKGGDIIKEDLIKK